MVRLFKFSILFFGLLFSVNISLAQKAKPKAKPKTIARAKVDLGELHQNTYTNNFFGLKIEFPAGWLVGDNLLEAQLIEIQKAALQTKNANQQAALNNAMNRVTPLLGGYQALPGSLAENSNLRIVVEDLAASPKIKTSQDYLKAMLNTLKLTKLPPNFFYSEIKNEMVAGKSLDYLETKYLTNQKRSYVMLKKGFAVLMTIDSYRPEDFDALHQVLTEADLDYQK